MIRPANDADAEAILAIIHPVFQAGETNAVPRDISAKGALEYWFAPEHEVFVAEEDGAILGTYFLQANQRGPGGHVANCGYITAIRARGRGIARAMCAHSLDRARERGFRSMQFNLVVSTNSAAVALWQQLGFAIVGTLPGAFEHPSRGFVDAYVMYRDLK